MIALVLAALYGVVLVAREKKWEEVYLCSTKALFWLYLFFAGLKALLGFGVIVLGATFSWLLLNPLITFLFGTTSVMVLLAITFIFSFLQIIGSYFVMSSLQRRSEGGYAWRVPRLVVGSLFVFLGLWMF